MNFSLPMTPATTGAAGRAKAELQRAPGKRVRVQIVAHLQGGQRQRAGMVGAGERHARSGHVRIADGFDFLQAVFAGDFIERGKDRVEHFHQVARRAPLAESGVNSTISTNRTLTEG